MISTVACGIISHISFDFNRRMNDEVMSKTSHHYTFSLTEKKSVKCLAVVLKQQRKYKLRRRGIKYDDGLLYLKD